MLGGSSDDGEDGGADSDRSEQDGWGGGLGEEDDDEDEMVAGRMDGDGLPPKERRGSQRRGGPDKAGQLSLPPQEVEAEPKEVQLPEECWVEVLRAGDVRSLCTMGRVNR